MSELLLIRHGQARFGSADYDRLSCTGERQARLLGRHLAGRRLPVDAWISGGLLRQRETARLARECGLTRTEITLDSAFDEYHADAVLSRHLPDVLADDPCLPDHLESLFEQPRVFQKAFERALLKWTAAAPVDKDEDSNWRDFRARVLAGLERLHTQLAKLDRVAVSTSGGPIALIVAEILGADATQFVALNGVIRNASITRLASNRAGWRLIGFNDVGALTPAGDDTLITYR